jgi:hypothetical protein
MPQASKKINLAAAARGLPRLIKRPGIQHRNAGQSCPIQDHGKISQDQVFEL